MEWINCDINTDSDRQLRIAIFGFWISVAEYKADKRIFIIHRLTPKIKDEIAQ